MKKIDRITGILLIVFALFAYYGSYSFPELGVTDTGPAFFPRLVAIGIIGLSIILIVKSFIKTEDEKVKFDGYKKVLLSVGIMIVYLIGFLKIGFFTSSVFSLILIMYVMGMRKKTTILLVTILSTGVIYLIFYYLFNVPLPKGILI